MKRVLVILLAAVLLFGSVSVGLTGAPVTAAAASSGSSGSFVGSLTQRIQSVFRAFFAWLASLFGKRTADPGPEEVEIDTPPPSSQPTSEAEPEPTTGSTVICDSQPSEPTQDPTDESGTTMPSDPPGSHCDYEPSGTTQSPSEPDLSATETLAFNAAWEYASFSAIHTDSVTLYRSQAQQRKGKTVCVNAGHGTTDGDKQFTLCHPDGSPKVTGGSTAAGSTQATAVSGGTTFLDGTPEAEANLSLALLLKDALLNAGYDVLMIRENNNTQLDNIARTVFANNCADCHIALHYDSSTTDKGLFFCGVPNVESYREMEPVKSHFEAHTQLGQALLQGARAEDVKIYGQGRVDIDLTQTSYSTVPSVDLEVGDRASDHGAAQQGKIAAAIVRGVNIFFSN